jgi:hypothetical protein
MIMVGRSFLNIIGFPSAFRNKYCYWFSAIDVRLELPSITAVTGI